MPIPPDVLHQLARLSRLQRGRPAHGRSAQAEAQRAPARAARAVWAWLAADGRALAQALQHAGVPSVLLVDDVHAGYRGTLSLRASGVLSLCRRLGPAWGDTGAVRSAAELARRCHPAVVEELAHAIRDGSVWQRVERSLGAHLRRATRLTRAAPHPPAPAAPAPARRAGARGTRPRA